MRLSLRRGGIALFATVLPLSYGLVVACGGDDSSTPMPSKDASADVSTRPPSNDSGPPTTGDSAPPPSTDSGPADAGPGMNFVAVNALVPVPSSVQLCFAASATGTPGLGDAVAMSPQPTTPLAPGLMSRIAVPSLVGRNVRIFTYYTASLTALSLTGSTCAQLLSKSTLSAATGDAGVDAGDAGAMDAGPIGELLQTVDFDVSDVIPSTFFSTSAKYIIMPTGCPLSSNLNALGDPEYCGDPGDASVGPGFGDFHVLALQLDPSHGDAGTSRIQGLLASPSPYYQQFPPFQYGITYTDGGAPLDAGAPGYTLNGPDVDSGYAGFDPPATSGALPRGTDLPSLNTATSAYYNLPAFQFIEFFDFPTILSTSGLTSAQLPDGAYTLLFVGDGELNTQLSDGGPNPLVGMHLIANDTTQ